MTLKFFYNGIKSGAGKLQKAGYYAGTLRSYPAGTITIHARDCAGFDASVRSAFNVENNSNSQTDYFENDRIRVVPSHPMYGQVKAAHDASVARFQKRDAA